MKNDKFSLVEKAIEIALNVHAGQADKVGVLYIFHPLRVMLQMQSDEEKIIAVLHDTMEDGDITPDYLHDIGFSQVVIESIQTLTHKEGDTYEEYVAEIKPHPLARKVKLADLRDNMRIDRIQHPTEKDIKRRKKYRKAIKSLKLD